MQRRRLCTALLCALALSACSTSPAPEASAEHDGTADAIAAATAPPPPMEPAATLDSVVVASPAMAKQANVAMRFMGPPSVAVAFAGGYRPPIDQACGESRHCLIISSQEQKSHAFIDVFYGSVPPW